MISRTLAAAALGSLVAAAPAAAQAPVVAVDKPCYIEREPMAISTSGFVPGSSVSVQAEQLFAAQPADPTGAALFTSETAPIVPTITPDAKTFTLTAAQDGQPLATTTFQVANFAFSVTPSRARPTSKVRYRFSGFPTGRNVYVHVRRNGKTMGTTKLGRAQGACGTLSKRARFMPVRAGRVPFGTYTYQFDTSPKYRSTTRPALRGSVSIFRTVR